MMPIDIFIKLIRDPHWGTNYQTRGQPGGRGGGRQNMVPIITVKMLNNT